MLQRFACMLGLRDDQAEDGLESERVAQHVLSRRSFLGAAGALASGAVFSFPGIEAADMYEVRLASYPAFFARVPLYIWVNGADFDQVDDALNGAGKWVGKAVEVVADRFVPPGVALLTRKDPPA